MADMGTIEFVTIEVTDTTAAEAFYSKHSARCA
jgi:hypothetical protein